ncbi:aminotransferase class I/II-fold pyridoxal phosphate-dependent enzyme [Jeotgalibacillus soli]|uniref:Lysine decarboxylase n=1 Tax=Jeotgalibacillus soli TaxID=889306 RepID=A0A0C2W8X5_9BACL|nr:aminotransferase class I/II-fold pyridoxal phosphate-dependent enzyme [Jeotgalibacillus soli]KIL52488.1 hypothetical protein KP78_00230 [Jeotgalibacillus soli]
MDQSKRPLVQALKQFKERNPVTYHVPGHKSGLLDETGLLKGIGEYDVTELSLLDDLHAPEGAIKEAMNLLASHYGSQSSYFLVNGTTVGNLTMMLASCNPGDTVFIARNSHKSIIHACMLSKVHPVFLDPSVHPDSLTPEGISLEVLKEALRRYPDAKALVLTYPTYYGHTYGIQTLMEEAHGQDLIVLVDEAHGAHFTLGVPFPESALALGADVVVQSAHKTLPAMTMGSFLHIGTDRVKQNKIEKYLGMLQSSSPSYPIMASLDGARSYLATIRQADVEYLLALRQQLIKELIAIPNVTVIEADDPLKLMIRVHPLSGFMLQEELEKYAIYAELSDPQQVLFILPLLKQGIAFSIDRTIEAIKKIASKSDVEADEEILIKELPSIEKPVMELAVSLSEMEVTESKWISLSQAEGKISAAAIIPYPPGIPYLLAGEKITRNKIDQLQKWNNQKVRFQGEQRIANGLIKIVDSAYFEAEHHNGGVQ